MTAAYEVLCDEAADVGLGRRPFETPREYQRRLVAFAPECGTELERLTDLTVRANYALNGIGPQEARGSGCAVTDRRARHPQSLAGDSPRAGDVPDRFVGPRRPVDRSRPGRVHTPSFASRVASRSTRTNWSRSRRNSATSPETCLVTSSMATKNAI